MLPSQFTELSIEAERRLWLSLGLASAITLLEFVGGILSRSLALLSDSGHVLTDVLALGLSILAIRLARRPHTAKRTFGFHRAEIFAALVNGSSLILVAFLILFEAYSRFLQPPAVQGSLVLIVASMGLAGNLVMARILAPTRNESLNVKGAFLHVLGDTLTSVGVILGGLIVIFSGYFVVDPIVAVFVGFLILRNAFGLVRESVGIFMEDTPKGIDLEKVAGTIRSIRAVTGVHDLHIWTITSGLYALSGHVTVDSETLEEVSRIIGEIAEQLRRSFGIEHVTLQPEKQVYEKIQDVKSAG